MTQQIKSVNQIAPWKLYVSAITEAILCFIVTSFCLGIYLIHQEGHWALTILMAILYLVCFGIIVSRIVSKFSLAALMLAIPITPLLILIIVVSMLPILDHFQ